MTRAAHALLLAGAALLAAGCATPEPPASKGPLPPKVIAGGGECRIAPAQFAVGRTADAALQVEAGKKSGAAIVRVLRPRQPITMEFSAQRLNLEVDANNRVVSARCG